jgi:hypothetical protein
VQQCHKAGVKMDETLVKILNMATSGSYEESNIAIEQAYKYMKKKGNNLDDINFNALYNGHVVAIKMIARFSHEQTFHKDQGEYITEWTKNIYGTTSGGRQVKTRQEVLAVQAQNGRLKAELDRAKKNLAKTRSDLTKEQENVEKYMEIIKDKHEGLISTLEDCQEKARIDSQRSQHKIRALEAELKTIREKNSEVKELHEYMIHAKELQITNIKKELKILLNNLRFNALKPLVSY